MEKIQRIEARVITFILENYKQLGLATLGAVLLAFFTYGYLQYRQGVEERAYDSLALIQNYMSTDVGKRARISDFEAVQFNTEAEKWGYIEQQLRAAVQNHSGSKLRGLMRAYLGVACVQQGKTTEGIELMHQAAGEIKSREIASLYQLKAALCELNESDAAVQSRGQATLSELSTRADLPTHEAALYFLGEYAWAQKRFADAQNFWSQLVLAQRSEEKASRGSLFTERARTKLKLLKAA